MKRHPEVKWSEVARQSIINKAILLKKSLNSKDLLNLLPVRTRNSIMKSSAKEDAEFYKKMESKSWKRKKFLTQA
ncbi:hypothetical protein HYX09_00950 [Candidatus Woesearchaeota archaeon]|nr:hypothetical protein [Candidatus Woesearchaeota archaeon]